jgi:hypothetical protein
MRILHIEIEHIALEEHTVPADYSGVNIWTAKHLRQTSRPLYVCPAKPLSVGNVPALDERKSVVPKGYMENNK